MPYKASTKEEIEAKLEEGRNSPNNQPEKQKKNKSETDGRQRGRGKSFRFDDDLFTTLWANHNNYYKDTNTASMSSEEQFKAYHDFVISVFNAHTSAELAKSAGCKETEHNDIKKFKDHSKLKSMWDAKGKQIDDLKRINEMIYNFLYEKVNRKVDQLLPELYAINTAVTEPVGKGSYNWMWSEERKFTGFANKFKT